MVVKGLKLLTFGGGQTDPRFLQTMASFWFVSSAGKLYASGGKVRYGVKPDLQG
jgi:hypothetical protein